MPRLAASKKLVISATIVGNVLEWYEFGLYAYLGPTIATLFFSPSQSEFSATMSILLIFAIGFFSRPIGGLIFGSLGDRLGRRFALLLSIITMSLPTFIIGFLPTFAQAGYFAPICLCFFRLIQGIPVGGEFPGTICYLMESAGKKSKGFFSSFAFFGSQVGILLNVVECLLLESFLSKEQILDWGWRLSFFVGGCIGLFGFYLRHKLRETPLFETLENRHHIEKAPVHRIFKTQKKGMLYGFLLGALPLGGFYEIFLFTSVYLQEFFHFTVKQGLLLSGAFLLISTITLPIIGMCSDRTGPKKMLIFSFSATVLLSLFLLFSFDKFQFLTVFILTVLLVISVSASFALIPQAMAYLFPTSVRFTSLAFAYNLSNVFFAAAIPLGSAYFISQKFAVYSMPYVLVAFSMISLFALLSLKEEDGSFILVE